jgi:release factor glutamine methyltransferase
MYLPHEDSYLLSQNLENYLKNIKNKKIKILDMGSGSGIQAKTCIKNGFKNVSCIDIDDKSLEYLKKQNLKFLKSNLFENLSNKKFNLIIFNPPYLPKDKKGYDKEKDTTGGKKGGETIIKFLKQAKNHLSKDGKILLLFSSLTKPNILKIAKQQGYLSKLLDKKKLFFEEIYVYLLEQK